MCRIALGVITYPSEGDAYNCDRVFFNPHAELLLSHEIGVSKSWWTQSEQFRFEKKIVASD